MSDDWRVHAALAEEVGAHHLLKGLHEREFKEEVQDQLPDRLPVTTNGPDVFVYAGDRAQAEQSAAVVAQILDSHGLVAEVSIACWHPEAEEWRPPDEGLPDTPEEQAAEREIREAKEAEESSERGPPVGGPHRPAVASRGARDRRSPGGRGPDTAAALDPRLHLGRHRGRRAGARRPAAR